MGKYCPCIFERKEIAGTNQTAPKINNGKVEQEKCPLCEGAENFHHDGPVAMTTERIIRNTTSSSQSYLPRAQ